MDSIKLIKLFLKNLKKNAKQAHYFVKLDKILNLMRILELLCYLLSFSNFLNHPFYYITILSEFNNSLITLFGLLFILKLLFHFSIRLSVHVLREQRRMHENFRFILKTQDLKKNFRTHSKTAPKTLTVLF